MTQPSLESVWPETGRRLLRMLLKTGLDPETAADIVQEVAARAIRCQVPFESVDDLMRWVGAVGRRLAIDHWRAIARRRVVPLEDVPSLVDIEDILEHRQQLAAVVRAWPRLSKQDRHALSVLITGEKAGSRAEAVRWAVRRHAARARLAAMV